tara:strand:+ start:537 stop:863 length:327 start_codon:yes stop_codon:yes gene_type:complete
MTFKEFQNTARLLCNIFPHHVKEMERITGHCDQYIRTSEDFIKIGLTEHIEYLLAYDKDCFIFLEMQYGKAHEEDYFSYYLVIGNEEFFSDDLQKLEKILYNEHYKSA